MAAIHDPYEGEATSLVEHLRELRNRIVFMLIALAVGTAISMPFTEGAMRVLTSPLEQRPLALEPTSTIVQYFRVGLVGGVAIAMPMILYQIVAFIVPALTKRERRFLYFFLPFGTLLFIGGVLFGAFVAVPTSLKWLQNFGTTFAEIQYTLENYIGFVTTMLIALGIGFETPLAIFFLARAGVVHYTTLIRNIRWAFLVTAILAAVLTPTPDPITMLVVMIPLFLLYLLGVAMARFA